MRRFSEWRTGDPLVINCGGASHLPSTSENQTAPSAHKKPTRLQWLALALLVLSVAINYADRGNLGVALSSIETELKLTGSDIGWLTTGFFFTYAFFQIPAGWFIDRWNVNWVFAVGFLLWSAATGAIGLAHSFTAILLLRLLLGVGESIAYPSYSKIIAISFPEELRGTANGLIDVGSKVGPALGVVTGVEMVHLFQWRGMFMVIGFASLLWLVPWTIVAIKTPVKKIEKASAWAPGYGEILRKRKFWGTALGLFGGNYAWYFLLNWLPYYFERERHYPKKELALVASLPFWGVALSALVCGLLADAIIRRGYEPGRVRQRFLCIGMIGCCACMMPAVLVKSPFYSNALLLGAAVAMGAWSSNHWALTQRLSGRSAAGKWTAFQNCIGNCAGWVGAIVTGNILQETHSFFMAFAIACALLIVGVSGYWIVIGTPSEAVWSSSVREGQKSVVS